MMSKRSLFVLLFLLMTLLASVGLSQDFKSPISLYADIKGYDVGDVVTILVMESANAARESKISSSSSSSVGAEGSVKGNLWDFLPLFGASSKVSSDHSGAEGTQQKEKLTGRISAIIVEKSKNGMLKIQGEKLVEVNGERNIMKIEGYIRPRDIQENNTVYSYNIANAKIIYRKAGIKNKLVKPGTFQRLITWGLGIGLIVISVLGLS
ncbi:MAG: flagellar basal body L-ring protein FlgH [Candidatus Marinimicrobia bacterium]|nr:flagellar basal body L-ring protein FlgH [Candidatus Neomarinimicrobiota bacterium]